MDNNSPVTVWIVELSVSLTFVQSVATGLIDCYNGSITRPVALNNYGALTLIQSLLVQLVLTQKEFHVWTSDQGATYTVTLQVLIISVNSDNANTATSFLVCGVQWVDLSSWGEGERKLSWTP